MQSPIGSPRLFKPWAQPTQTTLYRTCLRTCWTCRTRISSQSSLNPECDWSFIMEKCFFILPKTSIIIIFIYSNHPHDEFQPTQNAKHVTIPTWIMFLMYNVINSFLPCLIIIKLGFKKTVLQRVQTFLRSDQRKLKVLEYFRNSSRILLPAKLLTKFWRWQLTHTKEIATCTYIVLKFIYSEKATNFCEISTLDLWPSQNIWTLSADYSLVSFNFLVEILSEKQTAT